MDIKDIKKNEVQEIIDFYYHLQDYGHVFHLEPKLLDEPFKKILEGIEEVRDLMDKSFGI